MAGKVAGKIVLKNLKGKKFILVFWNYGPEGCKGFNGGGTRNRAGWNAVFGMCRGAGPVAGFSLANERDRVRETVG